MIKSACRGVARGAEPKRSRSPRGPPVCISSIAQHAVPNNRYQVEFFRPQLRRSSTFVSSTPLFSIELDIRLFCLLVRVSFFGERFTAVVIPAFFPESSPVGFGEF